MADKKNWDEWIGEATKTFGKNWNTQMGIGQNPIGAAAASYMKTAYDMGKADRARAEANKRPKSKDYQSLKDVKDIGKRKK
jgi:hypothetical protein